MHTAHKALYAVLKVSYSQSLAQLSEAGCLPEAVIQVMQSFDPNVLVDVANVFR